MLIIIKLHKVLLWTPFDKSHFHTIENTTLKSLQYNFSTTYKVILMLVSNNYCHVV